MKYYSQAHFFQCLKKKIWSIFTYLWLCNIFVAVHTENHSNFIVDVNPSNIFNRKLNTKLMKKHLKYIDWWKKSNKQKKNLLNIHVFGGFVCISGLCVAFLYTLFHRLIWKCVFVSVKYFGQYYFVCIHSTVESLFDSPGSILISLLRCKSKWLIVSSA